MSGDWVVRVEGLSKVYRLYRKPFYRFLDVFGLCPAGDRYYGEHAALDRVNFTIGRGEKIAVIGRNGAGKSTLLKILTGVLAPTSGQVEVRGTVKALLEIGTGFHPEFTGRQNVLSSLAYQGIVGREAEGKLEDIVEFAELEEYIDQPMKTYSTGMRMRLMFSAATSVEPDVLIADEVLSVGDAYFTHKSLQRVRRLVEARGGTFVLVTHDLSAAVSVCSRVLWLDQGRIMVDGAGDVAVAAYHHSIKEQEERRQLRTKLREMSRTATLEPHKGLVVRIHGAGAERPDAPFYLGALVAVWNDGRRVACEWSPVVRDTPFRVLPSDLLETVVIAGRECLRLREHGDIFHDLNAWLYLPDAAERPTRLELEYTFAGSADLSVSVSVDGGPSMALGSLPPTPSDVWSRLSLDIPQTGGRAVGEAAVLAPSSAPIAISGQPRVDSTSRARRYGTAEVTIQAVRLIDETGDEATAFRLGRPMRVGIEYQVHEASAVGEIVAAVGIHREGYLPVTAFVSPPFGPEPVRGAVILDIAHLRLAPGQYVLAVGLFRPEMWSNGVFYTISPDVFDHRPHAIAFTVAADPQPSAAWIYVQDHTWQGPVPPSRLSHGSRAEIKSATTHDSLAREGSGAYSTD